MSSTSTTTTEELKVLFHTMDRSIYARLVIDLTLEPSLSKKIIGFWIWLERNLHRNFMQGMLCFPDKWLYGLSKEAEICFDFLNDEPFSSIMARTSQQLSYMPALISTDFRLSILYGYRDIVKAKIQNIVKDVCEKVFIDIDGLKGPTQLSKGSLDPALLLTRHVEPIEESMRRTFSDNDRTLLVTFFSGCPTSKQQLKDFLTRILGNSIEAIYAKIEPKIQFAGVLVSSLKAITGILGNTEVAYFFLDGKDFSVRR
ncbi:hypothetical protein FNV43_RR05535 [Rhamnella rubrinervis]|uniref:Uncharacterized protein n=1 Tax=Rhamnella rubrinervis TaxID=2594499 RepID=A0A8K0HLJ5_9ROSA|nr:hypothetical protein FNV43_RR05535 [Rhamnella rubrinervis]